MPVARVETPPVALPRPPVRLRVVLAFVLFASACMWLYPRAEAAWKLHSLAVAYANYAACMAGPTGPSLLRTNLDEFHKLVRRRLVSAPASDRPFAKCAKAAREISAAPEVERAHLARAAEFSDYGLVRSESGLALSQLRITTAPLAELSDHAWPFVREGYTRLIKPSLAAPEAPHPVAPPKPAIGRGLPSWRAHYRAVRSMRGEWWVAVGQGAHLSVHRSSDGVTFRTASPRSQGVEMFSERCPTGEGGKSFRLGTSADGNMLAVSSLEPDRHTLSFDVAPARTTVLAAACDERALVLALEGERASTPAFRLCPFAARCTAMQPPRLSGLELPAGAPLDVARVRGTTIVALTSGGVVRVASSRDDGRTWTPFAVAFDEFEHPELRTDARVPGRLLALGDKVFLYAGGTKPQQTYPVLVSEDLGASFRTP